MSETALLHAEHLAVNPSVSLGGKKKGEQRQKINLEERGSLCEISFCFYSVAIVAG